jgi:hypothetical protein
MPKSAVVSGESQRSRQQTSRYAFVHGVRATRQTLGGWQHDPWPALGRWFAGSATAAACLLLAVWAIAGISDANGLSVQTVGPPYAVGNLANVFTIFESNLLVLALHAMACVAGFIAGSSMPLQAEGHRGIVRVLHERGGQIAIAFVIGATAFSLSAQALVLGSEAAAVAARLPTSPGLLLIVLMAHAPLELTALFLPLAAWILASRRGDWDQLLAATLVTVAIALPMLFLAATIEVYVSPHILHALIR